MWLEKTGRRVAMAMLLVLIAAVVLGLWGW